MQKYLTSTLKFQLFTFLPAHKVISFSNIYLITLKQCKYILTSNFKGNITVELQYWYKQINIQINSAQAWSIKYDGLVQKYL